jgi:hypothetical protein
MEATAIFSFAVSRGLPAIAFAWCAVVTPVAATVYKCESVDGTPMYQDSPCPKGKELRDFDKDPPTVSVMPLGPLPGATTRQSLPPAEPKTKAKVTTQKSKQAGMSGNPAERKFLAPGINEGEVVTRVGPPDMKSGGGGRKVARWTYLPAPEDPSTITTLTFEHGRLVEVERKVVK